jgi:hypothetical protein
MEPDLTTSGIAPTEPDAAPAAPDTGPVEIDPGPEGTYAQLARLIQEQLPYSQVTHLPRLQGTDIWDLTDDHALRPISGPDSDYYDNHVVRRQGLHEKNTAGEPNMFKPNTEFTDDEKAKLINVNIPDKDGRDAVYELTKVLRIWYTYRAFDPAINAERDIGTFLIIGYVGNGQP